MKICIIGGGTTGWWAAGYLENKFPSYDIMLIESSDIPIIGVGESTLPMIKTFFESFGMDESDWMHKCDAVHKYGNIKQGWDKPDGEDFAFTFWYNDNDAFGNWYKGFENGTVDKHSINDLYNQDAWRAVAYHLHAEEAGRIVRDNCKRVKHEIATLDTLPEGYDLYIDCTGLRRQFVKDKTLANLSEHHLVNSAWVCPFELDENVPYTRSIARDYGWQFKIGLTSRTGTGYCYADKFVSDDEALEQFKDYTKHLTPWQDKTPRLIKWQPGWLENAWQGNVVAIGMSQGFIDPLESNALFMIQHGITTLANCLERGYGARAYNKMVKRTWKENSDYILHHYGLSSRNDTEFWKHYSNLDFSKTLWEHYSKTGNKYTNLYPDAIWATLGLYYENFTYYQNKQNAA
jgi:hypothetical protein